MDSVMKIGKRILVALFLTAILAIRSSGYAQTNNVVNGDSTLSWTTATWSSKDKYAELRTEVEKSYKTANDRQALTRILHKTRNDNVESAYRYAYTSYLYWLDNRDYRLDHARKLVGFFAIDNSYEMARIRFLLQSQDGSRHLKSVGLRLLRRKEEFPVRYELTRLLVLSIDYNQDRYQKALSYANKFASVYPEKPQVHSVLGSIYFYSVIQLKMEENRSKSIREYELYLKKVGKPTGYCEEVKDILKRLKSDK